MKWCNKLLDQKKVKGYQEHLAQAFGNAWSSSLIWQEIWKLNQEIIQVHRSSILDATKHYE